jgi:hypothetical protein
MGSHLISSTPLPFIQGVTKRALQLWKSIQIYKEDIYNVSNCHNVAKYWKFDARCTVVPNTATASALAVEMKTDTFESAERSRCVFLVPRNEVLLHKFKGNFALSFARNLPVGLQFTVAQEFSWDRMFCAPCQVIRSPICYWRYSGTAKGECGSKFSKVNTTASRETGIPNVSVWRVLRKRLHLKAYKLSTVQHLTDADKVVLKEFCMQMFNRKQDV